MQRTPKNGWLMPTFNPSSTGESPVFLPVLAVRKARRDRREKVALTRHDGHLGLQIEPSPTTGIQHMIPPLFHGSAARATLANRQEVLNKLAESAAAASSIREASPPLVSLIYIKINGLVTQHLALQLRSSVSSPNASSWKTNEAIGMCLS